MPLIMKFLCQVIIYARKRTKLVTEGYVEVEIRLVRKSQP